MIAKPTLTLLSFLAPIWAGADPLDVYGSLTEKTVLMSSALPRLSDAIIADLPAEKTNAITRIQNDLAKQGLAVVHDGPHFVRVFPEDMRELMTNGSLQGPELASLKSRPTMLAGSVNFTGAPLDIVLRIYAAYSRRTILRPAMLPHIDVRLQNTCPLTGEELAYAMETVLALNGIAVVLDGERFAQVVTMPERAQLTVRAPKPESDEKLLDPNKVPSTGYSDPTRPITDLERNLQRLQQALYDFIHYKGPPDRSAERLLKFHASLADKTAQSSKEFDGLPIWFHTETPLSKSELLYAIEATFTLNHLVIINVNDQKIRLGRIGDSAKGSAK